MHPRVYTILIGLTAWFALAVWSFAGVGLVNYLLFVVCGFLFVAVALMLILSSVGHTTAREDQKPSFRDWARRGYETWAGEVSGAEAATQILLPIAAAAVGMTAIGIIFYVTTGA
jgi:L-asparagine transporter-like permease